jgi:hypothetical protein
MSYILAFIRQKEIFFEHLTLNVPLSSDKSYDCIIENGNYFSEPVVKEYYLDTSSYNTLEGPATVDEYMGLTGLTSGMIEFVWNRTVNEPTSIVNPELITIEWEWALTNDSFFSRPTISLEDFGSLRLSSHFSTPNQIIFKRSNNDDGVSYEIESNKFYKCKIEASLDLADRYKAGSVTYFVDDKQIGTKTINGNSQVNPTGDSEMKFYISTYQNSAVIKNVKVDIKWKDYLS